MTIELPTVEGRMEIGRIHPDTGEITVGANAIQFSCKFSTDCCGNRDFRVPISEMDIERIEQQGYEIDQIVESLSPEIRFGQNETAEKNYWMKRKPFTAKCTFLEGNKCSIHEFKPFACRIFPFQLSGDGKEGYKIIVHPSNICKSVTKVKDDKSQNYEILSGLLEEVQLEQQREERYQKKYGR